MPVRRRSGVMCRLSMRLPIVVEDDMRAAHQRGVVLTDGHAVGWAERRGPYRPAVGDNVAVQDRCYVWVFCALEMPPVWCSTCASGPGTITTVSVSPSHLTT